MILWSLWPFEVSIKTEILNIERECGHLYFLVTKSVNNSVKVTQ